MRQKTKLANSRRFIRVYPTSWYAIPHREMAQHYPSVSPVVKRVLRIGPEPVKAPSAIAVLHKAFDLLDTLQSGGGAKSLDELVRERALLEARHTDCS